MNKLVIIGNLTADPRSRVVNTQNGAMPVCDFTVAANRFAKGQKVADFFSVTVWGKMADNAAKYLSKGRKVAVTGPVTCRTYQAQDGTTRAVMEIKTVEDLEYLSSRQDTAEAGQHDALEDQGYTQVSNEELPF